MADSTHLKARLAVIVKKQQAALDQLGTLLAESNSSTASIEGAQAVVARLSAQYQRLVQELKMADLEKPERYGSYNARSGQRKRASSGFDRVSGGRDESFDDLRPQQHPDRQPVQTMSWRWRPRESSSVRCVRGSQLPVRARHPPQARL